MTKPTAIITTLAAILLLFLGDRFPEYPERLRGFYPPLIGERMEAIKMYNMTAASALRDLREALNSNNVTLPIFRDRVGLKSDLLEPVSLCVGILTARRGASPVSYLTQLVSSLLVRMDIPDKDVYFHVFNVDAAPDAHKEIEHVSDLIPVTRVKASRAFVKPGMKLQVKEQEALDYADAFRIFKTAKCSNILMLEDDAFPSENWLSETRQALRELASKPRWFITRLYTKSRKARKEDGPKRLTSFNPGYNTVAVLVNGEFAGLFADRLDAEVEASLNGKVYFEAKDLYISKFSYEEALSIHAVEPVIFQHTGFYSSLGSRKIIPTDRCTRGMTALHFDSEYKPVVFNSSRLHINTAHRTETLFGYLIRMEFLP